MNMQQLPTTEHVPSQMDEQLQQPIFIPSNNPASKAHVMPPPTANWSMELMPWKIKTDHTGDLMEFTAHAPDNNEMRRAVLHQKRKSQFDSIGTLPVKQFISEEKITAHFNGLHISSDYIQHNTANISANNSDEVPSTSGKCFSNLTYEDYQITAKELEKKLRNANCITVCEELKKFNDEQNKISYLPEALLHHMSKPCKALVLWQPSPITNIFSQKNAKSTKYINEQQEEEPIDDYISPDIDLSVAQQNSTDDFIDNNNTCNLDFNNIKSDSMDEDL